jgi:hypothetical protein
LEWSISWSKVAFVPDQPCGSPGGRGRTRTAAVSAEVAARMKRGDVLMLGGVNLHKEPLEAASKNRWEDSIMKSPRPSAIDGWTAGCPGHTLSCTCMTLAGGSAGELLEVICFQQSGCLRESLGLLQCKLNSESGEIGVISCLFRIGWTCMAHFCVACA